MSTDRRATGLRVVMLVASLGVLGTLAGARIVRSQEGPAAPPRAREAQRAITEIEADLKRLAMLEQEWWERAEAAEAAAAARLQEVAALEARLAEAGPGSEAAGDVFDRSKELTGDAVAEVRVALARAARPSEIPRCQRQAAQRPIAFSTSGRPPTVAATGGEAARLAELEELREEKTRELEALELGLRDESIDRRGAYAGRLWRLRLATLEALPAERHGRLSSLTRERWEEILFDFDVARLVLQMQWFRLRLLVASLPHLVRDFFAVAALSGVLLRLALVVLLWRWAQHRRPRALVRLRQRAAGLGRARVAAALVEAAAPWGIFLLGLVGLRWALGTDLRDLPLLGPLIFLVATIYGAYRLAADLLVAALASGAEHTAFEMTAERRTRVDHSVRRVLGVAVAMFLLPVFYVYSLEGGVLYEALRAVGLTAVLGALVAELAPWRQELAEAALRGADNQPLRQPEPQVVGVHEAGDPRQLFRGALAGQGLRARRALRECLRDRRHRAGAGGLPQRRNRATGGAEPEHLKRSGRELDRRQALAGH